MALALRALRFEQLEDKRLLAGDVTVSVVQGSLVVTGDELGNQIAISSGDEAGEFVIQGLDGTLLHLAGNNGTGQSELAVTGVRNGINVVLKGGEDAVTLSDARVRGNVVIDTGADSDHVDVGQAAVGAEPLAAVAEDGVGIGGSLIIRTGGGSDVVRLGNTNEGSSELTSEASEFTPSLRVGQTLVTALGAGDDQFNLNAAHVLFAATVDGGQGGDSIDVSEARTKALTLLGGAGDFADSIGLDDVYAAVATIGTGQGSDDVEILDSAFGVLTVRTAGGNDTVTIGETKAGVATLLGGDGSEDTYNDQGGNDFRHKVVLGFEVPEDVNVVPRIVVPFQSFIEQVVTVGQGLLTRLADRLRGR